MATSFFSQGPSSQSSASSFQQSTNRSRGASTSQSGQQYTPQQQGVLNQLFPRYQQMLQGVNPQQPFGDRLASVGGVPTPFPNVPIVQGLNQEQVGKGMEQFFSNAVSRTGGEQRLAAQNAAGRGYGVNSPALADLNQQIQGRNYRTAVEGSTGFELGAARQNADFELQSWLARIGSAQAQSQDEIRRRQLALADKGIDVTNQNSILNALNINLRPLSFAQSASSQNQFGQSRGGSVSSSVAQG